MALQNVDVIDVQSFQAVLHRREDVLEQAEVSPGRVNTQVQADLPCGRVRSG
jgi:hypothetical protein